MAMRILSRKGLLGFQIPAVSAGISLRGLKTFTLPDLPYDYGALEPAISGEIMRLHHQKHHQAYITNYNAALEKLEEAMQKGDSSTIVHLQSALKFNGGGLSHFSLFLA